MKKIAFLIISIMFFIVGCSGKETYSENKIITIETPLVVTNGLSDYTLTDTQPLPIKSFKVIDSTCDVNVELIKATDFNEFNPEKIQEDEMFKYEDIDKYSVLKFNFLGSNITQKYKIYSTEFQATVEIELYENELVQSVQQSQSLEFRRSSPFVEFVFFDAYNGEFVNKVLDLTSIDEAQKQSAIGQSLEILDNEAYKKTKENQNFKELINILNTNIASKNDYDKAYYLYQYITQNFEYDYSKAKKLEELIYADSSSEDFIKTFSIDNVSNVKKGICFDFTYLYNALCNYYGIPSNIVLLENKYNGVQHSINIIEIGDKYYYVDTTSGIANPNDNFFEWNGF